MIVEPPHRQALADPGSGGNFGDDHRLELRVNSGIEHRDIRRNDSESRQLEWHEHTERGRVWLKARLMVSSWSAMPHAW